MKDTMEATWGGGLAGITVSADKLLRVLRGTVPRIDSHVTDLATGFSGQVIEERRRKGRPAQLLVAPDRVAMGRKLATPRWVAETHLRVDHAIRRAKDAPVAGAPARYTHPQQEAMAAVLWQFAADLQLRPQAGEAIANGTGLAVSRDHIERALDALTAALGYVPAAE